MSYVILAGQSNTKMLEQAALYLRIRGHRTDVANDADQTLQLFAKEPPEVCVLALLEGYALMEQWKQTDALRQTQIIRIVYPDNITGQPPMAWAGSEYSNVLLFPSSWQIVLAVEQLLYRQVTATTERMIPAYLEFLVFYVLKYLQKHETQFPVMTDFPALEKALAAAYGLQSTEYLHHPDPSRQFCPNSTLSQVSWKHLTDTTDLVLFYEDPPHPDGTRWVAFLEGTPGHFHPRLERLSVEAWQGLRHKVSP